MRLGRLGILCAVGALVISGCSNNGLTTIGTTTALSAIRFLNGSPDAGTIDVYVQTSTATPSGTPAGAALPYGKMSAYANYNTQVYTIVATAAGTATAQKVSCTTPTLVQNTRYTIVIAGKAASTGATGLQCQVFAETLYSLPAGQFQLAFHHASPALNAARPSTAEAFGLYPAGTRNYQLQAQTATFVSTLTAGAALGTAVNTLLPGVQVAPGLGVYAAAVSPNPPTTVDATGTPSQATQGLSSATAANPPFSNTASDTNNFFPYVTTGATPTPSPSPTPTTGATPTPVPTASPAATTVSSVLSAYLIDGQGSNVAQLVLTLD